MEKLHFFSAIIMHDNHVPQYYVYLNCHFHHDERLTCIITKFQTQNLWTKAYLGPGSASVVALGGSGSVSTFSAFFPFCFSQDRKQYGLSTNKQLNTTDIVFTRVNGQQTMHALCGDLVKPIRGEIGSE